MKFYRRRKTKTLLDITPLIDCVFLLLVFFLLTSSFIEEAGLKIELPESAHAAPLKKGEIVVTLSEKGGLAVNGRPSSLNDLQADIAAVATHEGAERVVLRADRNTRLGLLTNVMDRIRDAGIRRIDIQAMPSSTRTGGASGDLP